MRLNLSAVIMVSAMLALPQITQAQTRRVEQKRREILDKLGLDKAPSPPATQADKMDEVDEPAEVDEPSDAEPVLPAAAAAPAAPAPRRPRPPSFRRQIHPWLVKACQGCHQKSGPAGTTGFVIGQGLASDHAQTLRQVKNNAPARSPLVLEATGQNHGGGTVAAPKSREIRRLIAWIAAGAPLEDVATDEAEAEAPEAAAPPAARRTRPSRKARGTPQPQAEAAAEPLPETAGESMPESPAESMPESPAESTPESPAESTPESSTAKASPTPAAPAYNEVVHDVLIARCQSCHNPKGLASRSSFTLAGDVARDYAAARAAVVPGNAKASPLLAKATGEAHMKVFETSSDDYQTIAAWINAGAQGPFAPAEAPAQAEAAEPGKAAEPDNAAAPSPPRVPAPPPQAMHPHAMGYPGGLNLPLGLRLNGRFDMAFERRGISAQPFASGETLFQNYHHFLFLSRDEADDPVTFTVELVALTFWEAHIRVTPREAPVQVRLKMGKLIVPFGAEPLFHQSYGGLQGFDQRVVPVFWAQNGFGARLNTNVRDVSVLADVYAVRGYALREEGDVLNLQSHFSPTDDVRPSYGARLNLSWRSLSGYYSLIVNQLGFGRTLVMQALDFSMWRWHGVPVLERLTLGFGFLRADVSGGGAGNDYYHFASYAQARFYITDSVFVQYRQGLRTFNNRRGVLQDNTRFTSDDGSAHNLGLVWRHRGLSVGAYQFWNLEKVNEIRNDFFRLMVAYEF